MCMNLPNTLHFNHTYILRLLLQNLVQIRVWKNFNGTLTNSQVYLKQISKRKLINYVE